MTTYPVHVDARLDARLSRWLWLVKWLLAVPHYVVLAFLWIAFAVTSVIAFFGILFTGRYPRTLFDFNVGVLRWTWRVAYYSNGTLGTDRYPPFTLHEVPDYPAHLEVDYPQHLSRGLVLVKWWLLAIPHYIVIGVFLGGAGYAARHAQTPVWDVGLIGFLVLVAGIALLFTGRYPSRLFDLVLGLDRWVLRVAAYVALMTDTYPPFALDQGGQDPDARGVTTEPPPAPAPPAPQSGPTRWTAGHVVSLVLGCLAALVALGLALASIALLVVDRAGRDATGYLTSPQVFVGTTGYAVTSENLGLHMRTGTDSGSSVARSMMGDVRITAIGQGGARVFVGIAPTVAVERYLGGVDRCILRDVVGRRAVCDSVPGRAVPPPPSTVDIWARTSSGLARQTLTWSPRQGDWTVVVMNADASPAVAADVSVGARAPVLPWVVGALAVLALVATAGAVALIAVPIHLTGRRPAVPR